MKLFTPSMHVPPFQQGIEEHSLTLVLHNMPEKPATQAQVKLFTPSLQVAPLSQGKEAHSLMLVLQRVPE